MIRMGVLAPSCLVSPWNALALLYDPIYDNAPYLDERTAEHLLNIAESTMFAYCVGGFSTVSTTRCAVGCVTQIVRRQASMGKKTAERAFAVTGIEMFCYCAIHSSMHTTQCR